MADRTVGDLLVTALSALGVQRVFGDGFSGLATVPVGDPAVADLLADVDGRIARVGASFHDRVLRISSRPGTEVDAVVIDTAEALAAALATTVGQEVPDTFALELDLDLAALTEAEPRAAQARIEGVRLSPDLAADVGVLVGPGVLRVMEGDGVVEHLQRFAAQTGLPVV